MALVILVFVSLYAGVLETLHEGNDKQIALRVIMLVGFCHVNGGEL